MRVLKTSWLATTGAIAALLGGAPAARAEALTPLVISIANAACPERPALEEALARRGLGATAQGARFRLQLAGSDGVLDVTLRDDDGAVLLARTLATDECAALAETVAMLVERRLAGIAWRAPAVAPPSIAAPAAAVAVVPPVVAPAAPRAAVTARTERTAPSVRPWALDVQIGGLFATGFAEAGAAPGPELAFGLRPPDPMGLRLSVGWIVNDGIAAASGQARIERVPIGVSGGYAVRRRQFELDLGVRGEIELLFAESRDIAVPGHDERVALRAGPAATGAIEIAAHTWLAVHGAALGVLSGWDFYVKHRGDPTVRTRVASQVLALELGASLGYRLGP